MKAYLCFVPVGGGEADYWLETEMPQAPSKGDWIRLIDKDESQAGNPCFMRDFTVGQVEWEFYKKGETVEFASIRVECEFAESSQSCDDHRRSYAIYAKQTGKENKRRETMF